MRSNYETVKRATKAQILGEYELIKAKKSKLSRNLRDRITAEAKAILGED